MMLLAAFSLSSPLVWIAIAVGGYLLLSGGPQPANAAKLTLPYEPPQRLAPITEAVDHLHRVANYLEAKQLAAEATPHIDALAALLNRRG